MLNSEVFLNKEICRFGQPFFISCLFHAPPPSPIKDGWAWRCTFFEFGTTRTLPFPFVTGRIHGWDTANSWKLLWLRDLGHVAAEVSSIHICLLRQPFRSISAGSGINEKRLQDFFFSLICLDVPENCLWSQATRSDRLPVFFIESFLAELVMISCAFVFHDFIRKILRG